MEDEESASLPVTINLSKLHHRPLSTPVCDSVVSIAEGVSSRGVQVESGVVVDQEVSLCMYIVHNVLNLPLL